jgi:hypothetical protein
MRSRVGRFATWAIVYLGLSLAWIYGALDQGKFESSDDWRNWSVIALVLAFHVTFGWVIREWYPVTRFSEPLPLWISQAFFAVVEIPAIACGLVLRRLYAYWRRTPSPSR